MTCGSSGNFQSYGTSSQFGCLGRGTQIAHGPIIRNERGSTKYAPSPVLSPSLSLSAIHPARLSLAARTVVEPRGVPAANGNRVEAADEVDKFVRAFPVQDDQVIKFRVVRVFSSRLNSDFPNYAQFTNDMNLDLATLFSQLAGISATSTAL